MTLKNKIRIAKVKQHLYRKPNEQSRKIHLYFILIFICLFTNGFAWLTYTDLAEASSIVVENRWVVRESPENSGIAPVGKEEYGNLVPERENNVEKLLKAICTVESNCNSDRIGDGGYSYGAFQIYLPAHPTITKEQAMDFEWAKKWTLNHCKKYLHDFPTFAKCHNGIGKTTNQWYVDKVMNVYNSL